MQQHDSDALIHEDEQIFNKLIREEIVPRYGSISPPYYWKEHEDEELRILNLKFIMWLNKKLQLRASKCLEELSQYL